MSTNNYLIHRCHVRSLRMHLQLAPREGEVRGQERMDRDECGECDGSGATTRRKKANNNNHSYTSLKTSRREEVALVFQNMHNEDKVKTLALYTTFPKGRPNPKIPY